MWPLWYIVQCEALHCLFALLCASGPLFLTWTILSRAYPGKRIWPLLCLVGFALAATSHYLADELALGF
jgi:hypothetical protein